MKHFRALKKIEVENGGETVRIVKGEVFAFAGKVIDTLEPTSYEEIDPKHLDDVPLDLKGNSSNEDEEE